jgi:hypothetical protein
MTITVLHHDDCNDPTQAPIDVHLKKNNVLDHNYIKLAIKEALGDLEERDVVRVWQARKTADGLIKRKDDIANMTAEHLKNAIHLGAKNRVLFLWYNKNESPQNSRSSSPSSKGQFCLSHTYLCLVILWLSADLFINILFVRKISRC